MSEEELRRRLAANIALYRKRAGLTQWELSEKINYSDKSVSKWERGEGLPDVTVLVTLSELFGVTADDLLRDPAAGPAPSASHRTKKRLFVTALSLGLVWLTAAVAFFLLKVILPEVPRLWLSFLYAVPASAIVAIVFTKLWWPMLWRFLSVSALIWSLAASVDVTAAGVSGIFLIYIVGAVVQILTVLWYGMKRIKK